jgi:hypothetical protein
LIKKTHHLFDLIWQKTVQMSLPLSAHIVLTGGKQGLENHGPFAMIIDPTWSLRKLGMQIVRAHPHASQLRLVELQLERQLRNVTKSNDERKRARISVPLHLNVVDVFSRDEQVFALARLSKLSKKRQHDQWEVNEWEQEQSHEARFGELAPEILECVFGFLSFKRLCRLGCVSKQWAMSSTSERLWHFLHDHRWCLKCNHHQHGARIYSGGQWRVATAHQHEW